MAGRPRKPKPEELREKYNPDEKAPSNRSSTMGVDRAIANRIREIAHRQGISAVDITNNLLEYALEHATFEVERERVRLTPKDLKPKPRGG